MELSSLDKEILQHMLGADPDRFRKSQFGFRNHYATCGGEPLEALRQMEAAGLVTQGRETDSLIYFHATMKGCEAIGLHPGAIRRAMED